MSFTSVLLRVTIFLLLSGWINDKMLYPKKFKEVYLCMGKNTVICNFVTFVSLGSLIILICHKFYLCLIKGVVAQIVRCQSYQNIWVKLKRV